MFVNNHIHLSGMIFFSAVFSCCLVAVWIAEEMCYDSQTT